MILSIRRDPHNMAEIVHFWIKDKVAHPELRCGQIIMNSVGVNDLYNIEDDDLLKLTRQMYEK